LDIRIRYILIALGAVAVVIVVATLLLPRKARLALYAGLILVAAGAVGYVTLGRNLLPSDYVLETYASGLSLPVFALPEPGDSGRMFVLEKYGQIRIVEDGKLIEESFLDLSDQVAADGGEQGLLSMVFHPDYSNNGYFYLLYTAAANDAAVLARFQVEPDDPSRAAPGSKEVLIEVSQPSTHHNGGHLLFGPDGYMYVSLGDGGGDDWPGDAQDLSNLLGTIMRLDVSDPGADPPYSVPPDNPFVDQPGAAPEIWAFGLRNPWRFDFDPRNGDLYVTDVGALAEEEVNYIPSGQGAGANYGWRYYEGTHITKEIDDYPPDSSFVFPITEYNHMSLGGCSIIGGYVYHGQSLPKLDGRYLYADYCAGSIWALQVKENGKADVDLIAREQSANLVSFAKDHQGELYLVDLGGGRILKMAEK
jgi:glucose/arabinose dehydrogenase